MNKIRYVLTIHSKNAPGTLYRIAGLLLRKKINIESLHVEEFDPIKHISHFTIEIILERGLMEKLIKQIDKVIEVTRADYRVKQGNGRDRLVIAKKK